MKGYITQQQLVKFKLEAGSQENKTAYLWTLVQDHLQSQARKVMMEGVDYYNAEHTAIKSKEKVYYVEGKKEISLGSACNKVIHPFHKTLVGQKAAYIAGNPIVVSVSTPEKEDDEDKKRSVDLFHQELMNILGNKFDDRVNDWIEGASNQGQSWIHPYITPTGELSFVLVPASEIIPVYDTANQDILTEVYRYYSIEYMDQETKKVRPLYKLEHWTSRDVTYYTQELSGKKMFILDPDHQPNPAGHFAEEVDGADELGQPAKAWIQKSWGRVPFVRLMNNSQLKTDLEPIKSLIDIYDKIVSGWADDLEDFQEAVYVVKGYAGLAMQAQQGLSELQIFLQNLKVHKAIAVDGNGGVEKLEVQIPVEAKDRLLQITRKAIYQFGEGVDIEDDKLGNSPSGIALQFVYSPLDLKCNRLIRKLKDALTELMEFTLLYMELNGNKVPYTAKDILFTINKAVIFNEKEKIDAVKASDGIISKRTMLENHPYVDDVDEELKRLDEEEQERIDKGLYDLDQINSQQQQPTQPGSEDNANNE